VSALHSAVRAAVAHSEVALGSTDPAVVIAAAHDARMAADRAVALSCAVLPRTDVERDLADRAQRAALEAEARAVELRVRSERDRERAIAPVLAAVRQAMPGLDATLARDSQAREQWEDLRALLVRLAYRVEVTK